MLHRSAMIDDLVQRVLRGDVRGVARALRIVDDRGASHLGLLKALHPHGGRAYVLGITGTPGAGKSTLVDRLVEALRARGVKVAVVAVDPSSPFTGGAILGDRIRMQRHFLDDGVFIRSLATRGHLGGVSRSAGDVIRVLDAAGFEVIVVETVGVGQDELEIARYAHTTVLVTAPGMGDDIQAIKAGILEIADVFAVNKSDRDGADATVRDLEQMIALGRETGAAVRGAGHSAAGAGKRVETGAGAGGEWTTPVFKTVATKNQGILELLAACDAHRAWLGDTGAGIARLADRLAYEARAVFRDALVRGAESRLGAELDAAIARVGRREEDPYSAAESLVARALSSGATA
jgi:LAO/AO transport system kinase